MKFRGLPAIVSTMCLLLSIPVPTVLKDRCGCIRTIPGISRTQRGKRFT